MPAVPLACHLSREREEADLPVEALVVGLVWAWSTDGCQDYRFFSLRFVLDFTHGRFFPITKVIPLPVLLDEESRPVHRDDAVYGDEVGGTTMPLACMRQRPAQPLFCLPASVMSGLKNRDGARRTSFLRCFGSPGCERPTSFAKILWVVLFFSRTVSRTSSIFSVSMP